MSETSPTRMRTIKAFDPVRGLTVAVWEREDGPDTISLVILDTFEGWSTVADIDKTDPGAMARAISLGEIIHATLEAADLSWSGAAD